MLRMKNILAVFSHPDDELAVVGRLLQEKEKGSNIHLVSLTKGENGHMKNKRHNDSRSLEEVRIQEYKDVCRLLQVDSYHLYSYNDNDCDNWCIDSIELDIERLIRLYKIDKVITFDACGISGHPDHIMTHHIITDIMSNHTSLRLTYVTKHSHSILSKLFKWFPKSIKEKLLHYVGTSDENIDYHIKLPKHHWNHKMKAMKTHYSQFPDQKNRYFRLPYSTVKKIMRYECYRNL
jgi:LmbE family N-acetylglucosaminyl deacetylase